MVDLHYVQKVLKDSSEVSGKCGRVGSAELGCWRCALPRAGPLRYPPHGITPSPLVSRQVKTTGSTQAQSIGIVTFARVKRLEGNLLS